MVIGAPGIKTVYVYYGCTSLSSSSCRDVNRVTITGPAAFGFSVSVSGSTIVVGAYNSNYNQGSAYIYYGCTSSTSTTCNNASRVTLMGPTNNGTMGFSVSISGSTVVVGAPDTNKR